MQFKARKLERDIANWNVMDIVFLEQRLLNLTSNAFSRCLVKPAIVLDI